MALPQAAPNEALQAAASRGGSITFNCGNESVVIPIMKTVSVEADVLIDGAGRISLDGGGQTRILMANNQVALAVRGLCWVNCVTTVVRRIAKLSARAVLRLMR